MYTDTDPVAQMSNGPNEVSVPYVVGVCLARRSRAAIFVCLTATAVAVVGCGHDDEGANNSGSTIEVLQSTIFSCRKRSTSECGQQFADTRRAQSRLGTIVSSRRFSVLFPNALPNL